MRRRARRAARRLRRSAPTNASGSPRPASAGPPWRSCGRRATRRPSRRSSPTCYAITSTPGAGIGQQSKLLVTPEGSLLWDPIGFLDDAVVERDPRDWARSCDRRQPPAHVRRAGRVEPRARRRRRSSSPRPTPRWVNRPDPVVETWSGERRAPARRHPQPARRPLPRQRGRALGGRRRGPGRPAHGRHRLRQPRPAVRRLHAQLPQPPAAVRRGARARRRPPRPASSSTASTATSPTSSPRDAKDVVRRSADRHIGWVDGDFDHLT